MFSFRSTLCLEYEPLHVACACLFLAHLYNKEPQPREGLPNVWYRCVVDLQEDHMLSEFTRVGTHPHSSALWRADIGMHLFEEAYSEKISLQFKGAIGAAIKLLPLDSVNVAPVGCADATQEATVHSKRAADDLPAPPTKRARSSDVKAEDLPPLEKPSPPPGSAEETAAAGVGDAAGAHAVAVVTAAVVPAAAVVPVSSLAAEGREGLSVPSVPIRAATPVLQSAPVPAPAAVFTPASVPAPVPAPGAPKPAKQILPCPRCHAPFDKKGYEEHKAACKEKYSRERKAQ